MSFDYFIIVVKNNWSWLLEFYDGVYEIQLSTIREDVVSVGGNVCYGNKKSFVFCDCNYTRTFRFLRCNSRALLVISMLFRG